MPSDKLSSILQTFAIPSARTQDQIRQALEQLGPTDRKTEPYCVFVHTFEEKPEKLVIKQYIKGTLLIQGKADHLYQVVASVLTPYVPELQGAPASKPASSAEATPDIPLPYIGTDESGKGDYFGPLVVAGFLLDAALDPILGPLGIQDSKRLSDTQCRTIAAKIRQIGARHYYEVVMPPERYNTLYTDFSREGKNLNHLLAWGHARAIESLLEYADCPRAVADQFGNESYIKSRLMGRAKSLQLTQLHRGERYRAVAAASILARDRFLDYMDRLSATYGMVLPKGASHTVVEAGIKFVGQHGAAQLGKVAKLHHKTTEKIIGPPLFNRS